MRTPPWCGRRETTGSRSGRRSRGQTGSRARPRDSSRGAPARGPPSPAPWRRPPGRGGRGGGAIAGECATAPERRPEDHRARIAEDACAGQHVPHAVVPLEVRCTRPGADALVAADQREGADRRHADDRRFAPGDERPAALQPAPLRRRLGRAGADREGGAGRAGNPIHDAADRTRDGQRLRAAEPELRKAPVPERARAQPDDRGEPDHARTAPPVERRREGVQGGVVLKRRTPQEQLRRAVEIGENIHRGVVHPFQPGPRTTWPGLAPVCAPSRTTSTPFTTTCRTPTDSWCGRSNVARSAIVAGSKTTMSAFIPSLSRPRSAIARRVATAEVALRTASSSVSTRSSRTYLPSSLG